MKENLKMFLGSLNHLMSASPTHQPTFNKVGSPTTNKVLFLLVVYK